MTYDQAVNDFEKIYIQLYINRVDYWQAQEIWQRYVDSLCKDKIITQNQYDSWRTPFPYGKCLKPSKRQLCMAYEGE